jgi:hypothetical protein
MLKKIPFADPSPDPEQQLDESKPPEPLGITPKAAFQWPQDCVWPFTDAHETASI